MNRLHLQAIFTAALVSAFLTLPVAVQAQNGNTASPGSSNRSTGGSTSNSPMVGRPGIMPGTEQTTGAQGLSSTDGEGGAGANESSAVQQNAQPTSTPTDQQRGAAPVGASSGAKNSDVNDQPNSGAASGNTQGSGSRGSSSNGGAAPITGSRQQDPMSNPVGSIPLMVIIGAIIVGVLFYFMSSMKRRKP